VGDDTASLAPSPTPSQTHFPAPDTVPSFGGDADVEEELAQDDAAAGTATGIDEHPTKSNMYFIPPKSQTQGAKVRARKTKSKKAALRGNA
jgi:hypothetical protein